MDQHEKHKLQEAFKEIDKDKDGFVTYEEIAQAFRNDGVKDFDKILDSTLLKKLSNGVNLKEFINIIQRFFSGHYFTNAIFYQFSAKIFMMMRWKEHLITLIMIEMVRLILRSCCLCVKNSTMMYPGKTWKICSKQLTLIMMDSLIWKNLPKLLEKLMIFS